MIRELLGLERRASIENPSFNLNDPAAWDALTAGASTHAGVKMSHAGMLKCAAVWDAVSLISGAVMRLPLNVYHRRADINPGAREADKEHPAWVLVRRRANPEMEAGQFWRRMMSHCLLYGNAYAFIDQQAPGEPAGLYPLLPDRTHSERLNGREILESTGSESLAKQLDGSKVYVTETNGRLQTFFPSEILHLQGLSIDGSGGCDLLDAAKQSIALALAQEEFSSRFFKQGLRAGGILEIPSSFTKGAKDNLTEGFEKAYSGRDNWFKTVILRDNAKFHKLTVSPEEGQLTEASEAQVRQVARWFKLPASKLGLSDSVSYNSKAEDNQAFLDDTLADWLCTITGECWMKLLSSDQQRRDTHFFEHNTKAFLAMNARQRHEIYDRGIKAGIYSPNDCRASENLLPREGGDVYVDPQKMQGAPKQSPEPSKDDAGERVLFGAKARHKAKNPRAFIEWVDRDHGDVDSEIVEALRLLTESVTPEDLPAAVDRIITPYERG